jgi:Ulp1 family protease
MCTLQLQAPMVAENVRARIPLSLGSLASLEDGQWLNDEVINCSMALLQVPVTVHDIFIPLKLASFH